VAELIGLQVSGPTGQISVEAYIRFTAENGVTYSLLVAISDVWSLSAACKLAKINGCYFQSLLKR
jgi:hypothetical protein